MCIMVKMFLLQAGRICKRSVAPTLPGFLKNLLLNKFVFTTDMLLMILKKFFKLKETF